MAAVLVQAASNTTTGASTLAVGSTQGWATPTSGNLLIAWTASDITMTLAGWTAGPSVVDNDAAYIWYKIAAGTESTVTFSAGSATSPYVCGVLEYSGLAATPFDVSNFSANQATNTTAASGSVTTTGTSGDLVFALACTHSINNMSAPSWTNGFTNQQTANSGTTTNLQMHAVCADLNQAVAGAISTTASWTGTGNDVQGLIIAFKIGAAAAPATIPPMASFIRPIGRR